MEYTANYDLKKLELMDAPPDITQLNTNWDTIDAELKSNAIPSAVIVTDFELTPNEWGIPEITVGGICPIIADAGATIDSTWDGYISGFVQKVTEDGYYRIFVFQIKTNEETNNFAWRTYIPVSGWTTWNYAAPGDLTGSALSANFLTNTTIIYDFTVAIEKLGLPSLLPGVYPIRTNDTNAIGSPWSGSRCGGTITIFTTQPHATIDLNRAGTNEIARKAWYGSGWTAWDYATSTDSAGVANPKEIYVGNKVENYIRLYNDNNYAYILTNDSRDLIIPSNTIHGKSITLSENLNVSGDIKMQQDTSVDYLLSDKIKTLETSLETNSDRITALENANAKIDISDIVEWASGISAYITTSEIYWTNGRVSISLKLSGIPLTGAMIELGLLTQYFPVHKFVTNAGLTMDQTYNTPVFFLDNNGVMRLYNTTSTQSTTVYLTLDYPTNYIP